MKHLYSSIILFCALISFELLSMESSEDKFKDLEKYIIHNYGNTQLPAHLALRDPKILSFLEQEKIKEKESEKEVKVVFVLSTVRNSAKI